MTSENVFTHVIMANLVPEGPYPSTLSLFSIVQFMNHQSWPIHRNLKPKEIHKNWRSCQCETNCPIYWHICYCYWHRLWFSIKVSIANDDV